MLLLSIVRRRCRVLAPSSCASWRDFRWSRRLLNSTENADDQDRPSEKLRVLAVRDKCGLPVMTNSYYTVRRLNQAYIEFLTQTGDPYKPLQDAIEDDPSCVLAHCMRGLMISLTHTDPTAVFHSLAMAEKEFATACRVEGVTIDFRRSSMIAGGSRRGSVVDLRREWAYLAALRAFSAGRWRQGTLHLENWLLVAPRDVPAVKFAHDAHVILGDSANARDCAARVMPFYDIVTTFGCRNVLAMYAFGLVECGMYGTAERHLQLAVVDREKSVWAYHAMAHLYEMEARASEGVSFLTEKRDIWEFRPGPMTRHVGWQFALHLLERGANGQAASMFDTIINPPRVGKFNQGAIKLPPPPPYDLTDACSLLWRMDIWGVETGEDRWRGVAEAFTQYTHVRHLSTFLDVHAIMAFAAMAFGAVDPTERLFWRDKAESMMKSMREYVRTRAGTLQDRADGDGDNNSGSLAPLDDDRDKPRPLFEGRELPPETLELHSFPIQRYKNRRPAPPTLEWGGGESRGEGAGGEGGVPDNLWVAEHLGLPLCEALYSYRGEEFEKAVSILLGIRYHLNELGGSKAQQDVIHITIIDAALRLPEKAIARALVCERHQARLSSGRAWQAYSTMLDQMGHVDQAYQAKLRAHHWGIGQGGFGGG